jgi:hypothetical protein
LRGVRLISVDHDFALLTLTLNHDRYAVPPQGEGLFNPFALREKGQGMRDKPETVIC